VTAIRGNKQVSLTWAAPLVVGSSAITSFKVMAVSDTTKSCTTNGTTLACNITGLTNGLAYTFVAKAISAAGVSAASTASLVITPAGNPGSPLSLVAANVPGVTAAITLTWNVPVSDSGAAITEYYGTGVPSGSCYAAAPATTCTASNLTYGTAYTFTVIAVNSVGTSAPSAASTPVTPVGIRPGSFVIHVSGSAKPFTFVLPEEALTATDKLTMSISDVYGRTVWSKSVNPKMQQVKELTWNGKSSNGHSVSAGMYVVKIQTVSGGKTTDFVQKAISVKPL
jgi:hypothetical protein